MSFVADIAKSAAKDYAGIVATGVVAFALLEPVCQTIKGVWESKMLGLGAEKTTRENFDRNTQVYDEINQKPFLGDKTSWTDFFTKVGMTFNKFRPFANWGLSSVAVPFLVAAMVLNKSK